MAAPQPTRRDYHILGQQVDAPTEACIIAPGRLEILYDPRAWPGDDQRWAIAVQDRLDEALALSVDCARFAAEEGRVAA